jgi:hypothetical protein
MPHHNGTRVSRGSPETHGRPRNAPHENHASELHETRIHLPGDYPHMHTPHEKLHLTAGYHTLKEENTVAGTQQTNIHKRNMLGGRVMQASTSTMTQEQRPTASTPILTQHTHSPHTTTEGRPTPTNQAPCPPLPGRRPPRHHTHSPTTQNKIAAQQYARKPETAHNGTPAE